MLGNAILGSKSGSPAQNRVFVYEVTGLKQNETNDNNSYQFRSSSSVFVTVPYSRMNEEMQRIGRMGGTIANIQTLESFQTQNKEDSPTATTDDRSSEADESEKSQQSES